MIDFQIQNETQPDAQARLGTNGPGFLSRVWWWAAERQGSVGEPYLSPVVAGDEEPLIDQEVAGGGSRSRSAAILGRLLTREAV